MSKIVHERDRCIGCGACASICSDFWKMSEDGKSSLNGASDKGGNVFELEVSELGCNQDAADACPVRCILV